MKRQGRADILLTIALCLAGAALLRFPREVSQAVREGLKLCAETLIPNLLPFFILSSMIVGTGGARILGRGLEWLMEPLFHLPGSCATALLLGFVGGSPTGARTAIQLYQQGLCTRQEAQRLLSFCSNCGPAFLIGTVGWGKFGGGEYGLLLVGVHISAALLTGVLLNRCAPRGSTSRPHTPKGSPTPLSAAFVDSVTGGMAALLNLCAFVLCFQAVTCLAALSGLPERIAAVLLPFLSQENGQRFLLGLLEMVGGVTGLGGGSVSERLILTAALVGWGGLSIHGQVLALLRDTDLSPALYFKGKALQSLLSAGLMWAILQRLDGVCLLAGVGLIWLPCGRRKKAVEKTRKVLYNRSSKLKGLCANEPVPEKN